MSELSLFEQQHYTGSDGVRLRYRRRRSTPGPAQPALMLLHGAASNGTRWWHFVEHTRLTDRLLLAPDLRGHGGSVWRGPARMQHWREDLAALLDHERSPHAVVIGHCLGANVAAHFAARHPDRCAGLVLIEPMLRVALSGQMARLRWAAPLLDIAARFISVANRLGIYRRRLAQVDLRELDRPVHASTAEGKAPELRTHGSLRHDVRVVPVAQLLANFVELVRPLPVSGLTMPCLVIQASGRRMTDAALTRELLAQRLPQAEFIELPSEHWIPTTHPERLCQLIDDWASGLRS
ncbi:MAG: alpha/beta hydrolase [Gammaproteobacteria bacterium]|nr:alpha/beta hydrolase [Gammaproteobacteria bacterium]